MNKNKPGKLCCIFVALFFIILFAFNNWTFPTTSTYQIDTNLFNNLINNSLPDEEYYKSLRPWLIYNCGEICQFQPRKNVRKGKFWTQYQKKIDCPALYSIPFLLMSTVRWPPPKEIPKALYSDYTLNGIISLSLRSLFLVLCF